MILALTKWPWHQPGRRLPTPGLAFGTYPQRDGRPTAWSQSPWLRALASHCSRPTSAQLPEALSRAYQTASHGLAAAADLTSATVQVRTRLRRGALTASHAGQALALAAAALQRTHGLTAYDTQVLAAWLMLNGHLVEMATGEGKTVAAALAAGVAGMAGTPVHVLTANEYLVQRDRAWLAPFYAALGLTSASITTNVVGSERHAAWRADVVYSTASQLAFDYLRDHLNLHGERDPRILRAMAMGLGEVDGASAPAPAEPMLPGLCLCLVDEADSILLDEAVVPLRLAGPAGQLDQAGYRRAFELSRQLQRQRDYTLVAQPRRAALTAAGRARVGEAVAGAKGDLHPARRACEMVEAALLARLLYRKDRDYAVVDGELQLIDELTGRVATGRQWQGALHPMVQLKEGLEPSPPTSTLAQITYQRFFPRYLLLAGMSGTVLEARHELRTLYGSPVHRIPLARPARRRWLGQRCCVDARHKWQTVVQAVQQHAGGGRPVLVGTDSVADSAHLSALLRAAGIDHQLLNATQDQTEAAQIARAGQAGQVTVATNMAGRGTDIGLDEAARAAGGLHVIVTMKNRSRRIDRQLFGRAARHGDPGSAEAVLALDDALLKNHLPAPLLRLAQKLCSKPGPQRPARPDGTVHPWLARSLFGTAQWRAEALDRENRRELRHTDDAAEDLYGFSGGRE